MIATAPRRAAPPRGLKTRIPANIHPATETPPAGRANRPAGDLIRNQGVPDPMSHPTSGNDAAPATLAEQAIAALLELRAKLDRDHGPETAGLLLKVVAAADKEITFAQAEQMVTALCRGEWEEVAAQLTGTDT